MTLCNALLFFCHSLSPFCTAFLYLATRHAPELHRVIQMQAMRVVTQIVPQRGHHMQVEHVSIWPPNPPSPQTLGGSGSTLSKFNPVSSNVQENTQRHTHTGTNTLSYAHRVAHTYKDKHKRTNECTHSHLNPKLFAIFALLRTSDTSSHCSYSRHT